MLRIAVAGVGSMGNNHARLFSQLENVELVGIADIDGQRAQEIGARLEVPAYSDCEQMLREAKPDAVSVVVPTALHEEIASLALSYGAHVLVEKPLASSLEEGERLVALANRVGRQIMVGHVVRFNPAYQFVKTQIDSGVLGKVLQVSCRRIGPYPKRIRDVGVVLDLATHDIDLMKYLLGESPITIASATTWNVNPDHEDLVIGMLSFPQGALGTIEANWLTPKPIRGAWILGQRGAFLIEESSQSVKLFLNNFHAGDNGNSLHAFSNASEFTETICTVDYREPLRIELEAFVEAIMSNTRVPVSAEDGLETLSLALVMLEARRTTESVATVA